MLKQNHCNFRILLHSFFTPYIQSPSIFSSSHANWFKLCRIMIDFTEYSVCFSYLCRFNEISRDIHFCLGQIELAGLHIMKVLTEFFENPKKKKHQCSNVTIFDFCFLHHHKIYSNTTVNPIIVFIKALMEDKRTRIYGYVHSVLHGVAGDFE